MAKGGRRPGAGRKPTGKVAMLVRVAPEVRNAIARGHQRTAQLRLKIGRPVERVVTRLVDKLPPARGARQQISAFHRPVFTFGLRGEKPAHSRLILA